MSGKAKNCTRCKEPIDSGWEYCPVCSESVSGSPKAVQVANVGICPHCTERLVKRGGRFKLVSTSRPIRQFICEGCGKSSVTIELFADDKDFLKKAAPEVEILRDSKRF